MSDFQQFILDNHQKIIEHYHLLLSTSKSDEERDRYRLSIEESHDETQRLLERRDGRADTILGQD